MADIVLTSSELAALTGLKQAKRQAAWLADHGWVFEHSARRGDLPKVDRTYYIERMSGKHATTRRARLKLDRM